MKVNGLMIISMEQAFRVGWMVVNTKESINKERRMVKANIYGKMVAFMQELGEIIKLITLVLMFGQMAESIRENG